MKLSQEAKAILRRMKEFYIKKGYSHSASVGHEFGRYFAGERGAKGLLELVESKIARMYNPESQHYRIELAPMVRMRLIKRHKLAEAWKEKSIEGAEIEVMKVVDSLGEKQ